MIESLVTAVAETKAFISEASKETLMKESSPLQSSMESIENTSLESLKAQNLNQLIENHVNESFKIKNNDSNEGLGLSDLEKTQIKNESGWSNEITEQIKSFEEYKVYKDAGLQESDINGKKCLERTDISWDQKDSMERSNIERAEAGLSPINKNGETIELHHIGQKNDGSFAELTSEEHRGKENYSKLHDTLKVSEIDRVTFNSERINHWKERINIGNNNG